MRVLTSSQMKQAELYAKTHGISTMRLMQNAGDSAFVKICEISENKINNSSCVVLCGSGNNGGDGFVIASRLLEKTQNVTVVLMDSLPKTECAQIMYERCRNSGCDIFDFDFDSAKAINKISSAQIIVDAIFGTGFHGELPSNIKDAAIAVNKSKALTFSIDLPSGANADTGEISKHIFAPDYTISLGAMKLGHILSPCKDIAGKVCTVGIGIPDEAYKTLGQIIETIEPKEVVALIPKRNPNSHKGSFGKLLNIAGSKNMSGAAALSTLAALRSGVGICTLASTESVINRVGANIYEPTFICLDENKNGQISSEDFTQVLDKLDEFDAITIGMGLGRSEDIKAVVRKILYNASCTVLIDADGIFALSSCIDILKDTKADIILTPHPGEMSMLTGLSVSDIQKDRINIAKSFAKEHSVTLVLKGSGTVIATPDGKVYINQTGNAGLARGGSGDVLSGMIGAFAAQELSAKEAAVAGVFLHGYCADRVYKNSSMQGMLPSDLLKDLPAMFGVMGR